MSWSWRAGCPSCATWSMQAHPRSMAATPSSPSRSRTGSTPCLALRRDQARRRADEPRYSHLYDIPATGLRFFTVYGPWGRPDMSAYIFTKAIFEGRPITVFNHGDMARDFTYIDDIVAGVAAALDHPSAATPRRTPFTISATIAASR